MKKIFTLSFLWMLSQSTAWACTVCKKAQSKYLEGITRGTGPENSWDYLIVAVSVAVVVGTFLFSVRYLIKPGESSESHIKNSILTPENI